MAAKPSNTDFEIKESKQNTTPPASVIVEGGTTTDAVKEKKKKEDYSEDDLLKVFDEIIFSGEYSEDVSIRGKLNVTFKTRTSKQVSLITGKLDSEQVNLRSTQDERRLLLNLEYALTQYQGKDLSSMKSEDKTKFIEALPAPIIGAILVALSRFDDKVYKACEVGEENF